MRALLLAILAAAPLGASAARTKIAVLDVKAVQGVPPGTAQVLTAIIVDDAARAGFDVISQADVTAMLGFEKQKRMLGCSEDSSCLAEIGGALGADYVLSGQVGQIGSRNHLSFQLLESRKARVLARSARFSERDEDALAGAAQQTVAELFAAVPKPGAGKAATSTPTSTSTSTSTKAPAATATATATATKTSTAKPDLAAKPPPASAAVAKADPKPFRPSKALAWGTVGAGGALLLAGAVAGSKASSARDDLAAAWQDPNYASLYDTKTAEIDRYQKTANLCYLLGAVTTGVGGWFVWKSRTAPVALAPVAGAGELGLVASGSF
jgi:TolB-like protein